MLRKLMLGAVAAMGIGFSTQTASAAPPIVVQPSTGGTYLAPTYPQVVPAYPTNLPPRCDDFVVFVKRGLFGHWQQYGRYETLKAARHAERRLERQGYSVRISEVRDGHRW